LNITALDSIIQEYSFESSEIQERSS